MKKKGTTIWERILDEPIEFDRWYRGEITEFDGENGKLFGWARFTLTKSGELYIVSPIVGVGSPVKPQVGRPNIGRWEIISSV